MSYFGSREFIDDMKRAGRQRARESAPFPVPTVLECDLGKLDELAKANPGHTLPELLKAYALWEIIDEDDAATGYREPGEDDES